MSRRAKLAITALFFVLFGWLYIHTGRLPGHARRLQFMLANAAQTALAKGGFNEWASVSMDGRTAILSGIAPDETTRDAAIAALKVAAPGGGVARVVNHSDLRLVESPYVFTAHLEGDQLTLQGYAPSRDVRDVITARAAHVFAGSVDAAGVEIASGAPQGADWISGVDFAVAQLVRLHQGDLKIQDAQIVIEGEAASPAVAGEVARQLRQAPAPFEGRANITAASAPAPAPEGAAPAAATAPGKSVAAATPPAAASSAPPLAAAPAPVNPPDCQTKINSLMGGDAVRFGFNDSEVSAASRPLLDAVADLARGCARYKVQITGHTDATGDAEYNAYLSQRRAQAVRDYLVSRGVDPASLVAEGHGASQPTASNANAEGRAANRRIEIDLVEPGPPAARPPEAKPQDPKPPAPDSPASKSPEPNRQEPNR
jgi:OOP family OmpA-OmpF porin